MRYGCSESAVNTFKSFGEVYDVIGNVWQLTCTLIYPFNGFQIHPYYEDFTTPTFDGLHDILKGGSFITQGSPQSRNFFRRHFYQFSGFRYVHSPNPITK
jgi:formylglycine-generating enzyme required for sulfatase activity